MHMLPKTLLILALTSLATPLTLNGARILQSGNRPSVEHLVFDIPGHGEMSYAISLPSNYKREEPRPLILALHPGGSPGAYYGSQNMRQIFEPALRDLNAIIVAPDVPTRRWTSDTSDRGVMALLSNIVETHNVDRSRILVTGFSLGGRGTWFFATHHPDFFTGAIPIAGRPGEDPLETLSDIPVHIIHSRVDDVVPFGPAEEAAQTLKGLGSPVAFAALDGVGHFSMGGYVGALREAGEWMVDQWNSK